MACGQVKESHSMNTIKYNKYTEIYTEPRDVIEYFIKIIFLRNVFTEAQPPELSRLQF